VAFVLCERGETPDESTLGAHRLTQIAPVKRRKVYVAIPRASEDNYRKV